MMSKLLISIFLGVLVCVSAQTTSEPTTNATSASTTESSTTASPSNSSSTSTTEASNSTSTAANSTTTEDSSTTTEIPTASTPFLATCQKAGRYPATSEKCGQEFIVCIPNFSGGFWQHKWKCAGSLVYNDKYKKCTAPRKADCISPNTARVMT